MSFLRRPVLGLCFCLRRAAVPATYGAEKLVPWSTQLPPSGTVETMSTPGAAMSTKGPDWEKGARSLFRSEAATARTLGYSVNAAGYMSFSPPSAPPLPAEATTRTCVLRLSDRVRERGQ